jgi:hypothetical protein
MSDDFNIVATRGNYANIVIKLDSGNHYSVVLAGLAEQTEALEGK